MMSTLPAQAASIPSYTMNLLSLLEERDSAVLGASIERLLEICDTAWPQIASSLPAISALAEESSFAHFRRAALLASKVAFHLEDEAESMRFALLASEEFVRSPRSDFSLFVTCRLVDAFVAASGAGAGAGAELERLVRDLVFAAAASGSVGEALGLALEAGRADWVEKILDGVVSDSSLAVLDDFFALVSRSGGASSREAIFEQLGRRYLRGARRAGLSGSTGGWWLGTLRCQLEAGDVTGASGVFGELLASEEDPQFGWLLAQQLALDLVDLEYGTSVLGGLEFPSEPEEVIGNLKSILSGEMQRRLTVDFLHRCRRSDPHILTPLKTATTGGNVPAGSEVVHTAVVLCNGLMHSGTTDDNFLRSSLDWLARANLWAKFAATASLGAVHKGHVAQGRSVLSTYLPGTGGAGSGRSPYSEGGALFGLGLVFAETGDVETRKYLLTQLGEAAGEVHQYGAALGLGLANIGRGTEEEYERVKSVLYTDNAVAGEAAGLAIGLLQASKSGTVVGEQTEELLRYGKETSHEKISRGCMLGVALSVQGRGDETQTLVERMVEDTTDPMTRYGGVLSLGMAYAGTASEYAIKKLLNKAVYDSSDDVKRTSVIALAFVLAGHKRLGKILKLLVDSYNPHIRYGVALALGLGLTGQAQQEPEIVELLQTMTKDAVDFVRQGAWVGLGLLLQQSSQSLGNPVAEKMLKTATNVKGEDPIVRMGAVLGLGAMNLGGRNARSEIAPKSKLRMAGLLLFSQYWFCHSWTLALAVAAKPTLCVGLNENLKMPRNFAAKAKAALALPFLYPATLKSEDKKTQEAAKPAAVLSVTRNRSKKLEKTPKAEPAVPTMEVEKEKPAKQPAATGGRKHPEHALFFNPFRVLPGQEAILEFFRPDELMPVRGGKPATERTHVRYQPLLDGRKAGWVILRDLRPAEHEDLFDAPVQPTPPPPPVVATPAEQPAPPEEFEWSEQ